MRKVALGNAPSPTASADAKIKWLMDAVQKIANSSHIPEPERAGLAGHIGDTSDAHDASAISFAPVGTVAATDAQAAIAEVSGDIEAHIADATAAHAASAISYGGGPDVAATTVESALDELSTEKVAKTGNLAADAFIVGADTTNVKALTETTNSPGTAPSNNLNDVNVTGVTVSDNTATVNRPEDSFSLVLSIFRTTARLAQLSLDAFQTDRPRAWIRGKGVGGTWTPWGQLLSSLGGINLTGGFSATSDNDGSKSTGTYTPVFTEGNIKRITNDGAFTLGVPSGEGTCVIQMTNGASAGTVTTSGFTKVTGDTISTTNGNDFMLFIAKVNGFSHLNVVALQ